MTKSTAVEETTHTLSSLQETLGAATLDEALELLDGQDSTALVREGAKIATSRISKDAARMYGEAFDFLAKATDPQLDHLPLFSRDWLRIAVGAAAEGDRRYAALTGSTSAAATRQTTTGASASSLQAQLEARREQLHAALASLGVGSPALLAAATIAYGSAADAPTAVLAQTRLVRDWRTSGSKNLKARLKNSRLTDEWLASADGLAQDARKAIEAASATRSKGTVAQADVDYVDGVNLALLRHVASWFEAGHAADATIPRITFNALHSQVHRSHHAAAAAPAVGGANTTTA